MTEEEYQGRREAINAELRGKINRMNQKDNYFLGVAVVVFLVVIGILRFVV